MLLAFGGEKTVFESICLCSDAPVAPSRGQQVKRFKASLQAVLDDVFCFAEAAGGANAHQGLRGQPIIFYAAFTTEAFSFPALSTFLTSIVISLVFLVLRRNLTLGL